MALTSMRDWVIPQTVETVHSSFNGEIKVVKFQGKFNLWSGGAEQSGELVEKVWRQAFLRGITTSQQKHIKTVLILGLGAGSLITPMRKILPNLQKIVGIEIDPVIIDLGKKYLGLGTVENLEIIISDVDKYLDKKTADRFDLVILDVYEGGKISELYDDVRVKSLINPGGLICINVLDFYNKNVPVQDIPGYQLVKKVKADYNHFYFLRPS